MTSWRVTGNPGVAQSRRQTELLIVPIGLSSNSVAVYGPNSTHTQTHSAIDHRWELFAMFSALKLFALEMAVVHCWRQCPLAAAIGNLIHTTTTTTS